MVFFHVLFLKLGDGQSLFSCMVYKESRGNIADYRLLLAAGTRNYEKNQCLTISFLFVAVQPDSFNKYRSI